MIYQISIFVKPPHGTYFDKVSIKESPGKEANPGLSTKGVDEGLTHCGLPGFLQGFPPGISLDN